MRRIVIGENPEYAGRLRNYLLDRLPADTHIHCFSEPAGILNCKERTDLYLLGEYFYEELLEMDPSFSSRKTLIITDQERDGCFCRLDSPAGLLKRLDSVFERNHGSVCSVSESCILTAVYAPFPGISLKDWIWKEMGMGDLYLGLQDIGSFLKLSGVSRDGEADMGELCYFIHLRTENILEEMGRMLLREEGKAYLDSPAWFFDILGLQEEDYLWFYNLLKEKGGFSRIYVGLGNAAIPSLEYFKAFDRIILVDMQDQEQIHGFCERFVRVTVDEGYLPASSIEVREAMR